MAIITFFETESIYVISLLKTLWWLPMFVEWGTPLDHGPSFSLLSYHYFVFFLMLFLCWCFLSSCRLLSIWASVSLEFSCTRFVHEGTPSSSGSFPFVTSLQISPGPWMEVASSTLLGAHPVCSPILSFSSDHLLLLKHFFIYYFAHLYLYVTYSDPRLWAIWWQRFCFYLQHKSMG